MFKVQGSRFFVCVLNLELRTLGSGGKMAGFQPRPLRLFKTGQIVAPAVSPEGSVAALRRTEATCEDGGEMAGFQQPLI
jgi:hypothetical protein